MCSDDLHETWRRKSDTYEEKVEDIKKQHFCHEHVLTGSEKSEEDRVFAADARNSAPV